VEEAVINAIFIVSANHSILEDCFHSEASHFSVLPLFIFMCIRFLTWHDHFINLPLLARSAESPILDPPKLKSGFLA
jgi:hypothetical protein